MMVTNQRGLWFVCLALGTTPTAHAVEFSLGVGAEATYTTNSTRVPQDELEQWFYSPSVDALVTHESSALELLSRYRYSRRIYQKDEIDDENVLTGDTTLMWNVVPERLEVELEHHQSESTIDSFRNNDPDNRQEVSRATGRIIYRQPIVGRQHIKISGSFTNRSYEESDNDADVTSAELAYAIPFGELRGVEIFVSEAETEFDDFSFADYDLSTGGVRFYSSARDGTIDVIAGYSETDPVNGDEVRGFTGLIDVQRGLESPFSWRFLASREISDRSERLDRGIESGLASFDQFELLNSDLTEIFVESSGQISGQWASGGNRFTAELGVVESDYENDFEDVDLSSLLLGYQRSIRENLTFSADARIAQQDFKGRGQEDDLRSGRVALDWQRNQRLSVHFALSYLERESDNSLNSFEEVMASFAVNYQLFN